MRWRPSSAGPRRPLCPRKPGRKHEGDRSRRKATASKARWGSHCRAGGRSGHCPGERGHDPVSGRSRASARGGGAPGTGVDRQDGVSDRDGCAGAHARGARCGARRSAHAPADRASRLGGSRASRGARALVRRLDRVVAGARAFLGLCQPDDRLPPHSRGGALRGRRGASCAEPPRRRPGGGAERSDDRLGLGLQDRPRARRRRQPCGAVARSGRILERPRVSSGARLPRWRCGSPLIRP